jgi:hypothetical protein
MRKHMARKTKPKAGAPRGNQNAAKPAADRRMRVTLNLSPAQYQVLNLLGGTTNGLNEFMSAVSRSVPVARTSMGMDGKWFAVWIDSSDTEQVAEIGVASEEAARLIAAYDWLHDVVAARDSR